MGIEGYSTTAEANTGLMPEGQQPGTVNNGVRQIQADLAADYNDPGWYRPGAPARTCTYLAANSFRDPGGNWTTLYHAGRRVRAIGDLTGIIQGTIQSSTFAGGNTDVVVNWDGSELQSEDLTISLGIVPPGPTSWIPAAAEGWRGLIELATAAEFAAGTDPLRALTPALFQADTGNPGYFKLPGGFIVQFGFTVSATGGFIAPNYPVAYTTGVAFISTTPLAPFAGGPYKAHPFDSHLDFFEGRVWDGSNANPGGITVFWLALGR